MSPVPAIADSGPIGIGANAPAPADPARLADELVQRHTDEQGRVAPYSLGEALAVYVEIGAGKTTAVVAEVLRLISDSQSKRQLARGYLDSVSAGGRRPPHGNDRTASLLVDEMRRVADSSPVSAESRTRGSAEGAYGKELVGAAPDLANQILNDLGISFGLLHDPQRDRARAVLYDPDAPLAQRLNAYAKISYGDLRDMVITAPLVALIGAGNLVIGAAKSGPVWLLNLFGPNAEEAWEQLWTGTKAVPDAMTDPIRRAWQEGRPGLAVGETALLAAGVRAGAEVARIGLSAAKAGTARAAESLLLRISEQAKLDPRVADRMKALERALSDESPDAELIFQLQGEVESALRQLARETHRAAPDDLPLVPDTIERFPLASGRFPLEDPPPGYAFDREPLTVRSRQVTIYPPGQQGGYEAAVNAKAVQQGNLHSYPDEKSIPAIHEAQSQSYVIEVVDPQFTQMEVGRLLRTPMKLDPAGPPRLPTAEEASFMAEANMRGLARLMPDWHGQGARDWAIGRFGIKATPDVSLDARGQPVPVSELLANQYVPNVPPKTAYFADATLTNLPSSGTETFEVLLDLARRLGQERVVGYTSSSTTLASFGPRVRITDVTVMHDAIALIRQDMVEKLLPQNVVAHPTITGVELLNLVARNTPDFVPAPSLAEALSASNPLKALSELPLDALRTLPDGVVRYGFQLDLR